MTATTKRPPAIILLVEDDVGDQVLTQEAFRALNVPHELRIVSDGKEALDYLYHQGDYQSDATAPRPDLILLDLNMPRVNGQQVAEQIHTDPALKDIPVVVLTTSRRQEDVLRAYGRGVTSFISKPLDFKRFMAAVQDLESLIKFVTTLKSLRNRSRVTDRQIYRLQRRRRQLEHLTDMLFDHQMEQIKTILSQGGLEETPEPATSGGSEVTRESLMRLGQKLLQGEPGKEAFAAPTGASESGYERARSSRNAADLLKLARALELAAKRKAGLGSSSPESEIGLAPSGSAEKSDNATE